MKRDGSGSGSTGSIYGLVGVGIAGAGPGISRCKGFESLQVIFRKGDGAGFGILFQFCVLFRAGDWHDVLSLG
jgi:hypothetical protein